MLRSTVTIKDVARAARVHYSTVSLALRGATVVAEETRVRVREAARRLGYEPNTVFSALSRYKAGASQPHRRATIAYVCNCTDESALRDHRYHRQLLAGARRQAEVLGYALRVLLVSEAHHDSDSLSAYLKQHDVSTLILAAFEPGFATLALDWDNYFVVKIDSQHMAPLANSVSHDRLELVRLAHQRLVALGYRRIGLAVGRAEEEATDHRHSMGYFMEQAALSRSDRVPLLLFPYNSTRESISRLLPAWVRRQKLDAVLTTSPDARGCLEAGGLRVPDRVAVAQLSFTEPDPAVAGVRLSPSVVGAKVVSQLATLLRTGQRGVPPFPTHTYVSGTWHDGASAPPKP